MKEFDVDVIEILSRTVKVKAIDYNYALKQVKKMYDDGEIVLTADDFKRKVIE